MEFAIPYVLSGQATSPLDEGRRYRNLRRGVLTVILSWIFTNEPLFAWLNPGSEHDLVFDMLDACSERVAEFLSQSLGPPRKISVQDLGAQARNLGRFIIDPMAIPYAEGIPMEQNPLFNWLMNAAILYFGSRHGEHSSLREDLLEPRPLCLDALRTRLSEHLRYEVARDDLQAHITHWLLVFSGYAGGDLPSRSVIGGLTKPVIPVTLAAYLGIPLQPLESIVKKEIDPQYAGLHERIVQFYPPRLWHNRLNNLGPFNGTDVVFAANVDFRDHELPQEGVEVREYWPREVQDREQLPVFIFFSGGGWLLGDKTSDEGVLSWICIQARCRVFNGGYRRLPFPTAYEDGLLITRWVREWTGSDRIMIGGVSAGGNVAAVAALENARLGSPPIGVLLVCACLDNSQDCEKRWSEKTNAPWLTPQVMRYYQNRYLPNADDRSEQNWKASPLFVPTEVIETAKNIPTRVLIMRNDVLWRENVDFFNRLQVHGCNITRISYDLPHMGLSVQGIVGPDMILDCQRFVRHVFEGIPEEDLPY